MEDSNFLALAPPEPAPRPRLRTLPPRDETETRGMRLAGGLLATLLAIAYFAFIVQYYAPAHPGVDQNGYLVGGKMLARTGSTGYKPADPLGFVSAMWVRVEPRPDPLHPLSPDEQKARGVNYPKYPIGLPLIYAIVLWTCGHAGPAAAYLISPLATALAVLGTYFLARQFAGTFSSLMAALLLAFSQVTLVLANNPNSHASCLAFGVWGVFLLIRFWERATVWRGLLGGFLLGFAATIRYTDGLLGLLIGFVVLSSLVYRDWRGYWRVLTPVIGWLVPMTYLVAFNLIAMHTPTGYDTTNESKPGQSFLFDNLHQNWEKLIRQVHDTGLFFTLPLGILGMALAYRAGARRATLLWLWLVPGTLTYMAYYWAPERGVAYLRFFLTLLPPLCVGTGILLDQIIAASVTRLQRIVAPLAGGLVVLIACSMSLYRAIFGIEDGQETGQGMEAFFRTQVNLAALAHVVTATAPAHSVLIAPETELNDLQFAGDYDCFCSDIFTTAYVARLTGRQERTVATDPDPLQPALRDFILAQLKGKSEGQLNDLEAGVVGRALDAGQRVYVLVHRGQTLPFMRRYGQKGSTITWGIRASYNELPRLREPDPVTTSPTDPRQKFINNLGRPPGPGGGPNAPGGPGGGNRGRGGGRFGGGAGFTFRDLQPQAWQLLEISKKPDKNAVAALP